ncbi:MAG: hypothetical protein K6C08_07450 [Oscillospiraceae bacterium]|nr:hypothetical protein [Oscillospiraceae bacterium]
MEELYKNYAQFFWKINKKPLCSTLTKNGNKDKISKFNNKSKNFLIKLSKKTKAVGNPPPSNSQNQTKTVLTKQRFFDLL